MPKAPILDNEIKYKSPLSTVLDEYIAHKRAAGNIYIAEAEHFRRMDNFAEGFGCPVNVLTKELVLAWAAKRPHEKDNTQAKRANAVKRLAMFMVERGYEAYVYPYSSTRDPVQYMPYIFTEDEMGTLLRLADRYQSNNFSRTLNITVPLVFRILYGCGLRTSEVLNLRVCDVDIGRKTLRVSESKFGKGRIVPMVPSLTSHCAEYIRLMKINRSVYDDGDYLIQNHGGGRYSDQAIYHWFRILLSQAGIPHGGKGHGPRVHDIRHTYAVHCLKRWVTSGKDIQALLPMLSAYMGHCDLRGTQIYLRLTPDLFPFINNTMNEFFSDKREWGQA